MGVSSAAASLTYGTFSFTQVITERYATPLPSPLTIATPYGPALSDASTLLPDDLTYTTWSLDPEATSSDDGPYGQSAYAALWADYTFASAPPFTTTLASPAPVPTSELVLPPPLYNLPDTSREPLLPSDFIWGVAGSAWQAEGGLQLEGRGPAAPDYLGTSLENPGGEATATAPTGGDANVANMHYLLYRRDIARLAAMGVPHYSLSVAWSRVVPFGRAGSPVNEQALVHYDDVIDTCIQNGITPIVTLVHVDAPALLNPEDSTFRDDYLYYAKIIMTRYADRVPIWVTYNEPNVAYSYPSITNVLMSHADVYHWYKEELKGSGRITLKFLNFLPVPEDPTNSDDVAAAFRYQDFLLGLWCNPIYLGEQYPDTVLSTPGLNITSLTDEELDHINGTSDIFSIDPYIAQLAAAPPAGLAACASDASDALFPTCASLSHVQRDGWAYGPRGNDDHAYVAPAYVRQQLGYLWDAFRPPAVLVTEFGFPAYGEAARALVDQRYDLERTLYYQDFLAEMLKAVREDGVNVVGALAWTFADNNEFGNYEDHMGMQTVNRTDGSFSMTYKRSFFDFVEFFQKHVAKS